MKSVSILGSTGSIGTQTLNIIKAYPNDFRMIGLSAHSNVDLLCQQIKEFKPEFAVIQNPQHTQTLKNFISSNKLPTVILDESSGINDLASMSQDILIMAIVGVAALEPTICAIKSQTTIGLANKEVLVAAGDIIMPLLKEFNTPLIPIDSEHAAIHQCLPEGWCSTDIESLILTASGGPFRTLPHDEFKNITVQSALKHPNWSMGAKISIDSATMMNKGLEVIEAHHLFNIDYSKISVVVHPQSIIHGLVHFIDGNIISQMSEPDMTLPIQHALFHPLRKKYVGKPTSLTELPSLTFEPADLIKFPLLKLAYDYGPKGSVYTCALNAANEACVSLFLDEKISFIDIHKIIQNTLTSFASTLDQADLSIDSILTIDRQIKSHIFNLKSALV